MPSPGLQDEGRPGDKAVHMVQPAPLGSDTADLPTPQQHLGAGNGSPAPAGVMGQSAVAKKVITVISLL